MLRTQAGVIKKRVSEWGSYRTELEVLAHLIL